MHTYNNFKLYFFSTTDFPKKKKKLCRVFFALRIWKTKKLTYVLLQLFETLLKVFLCHYLKTLWKEFQRTKRVLCKPSVFMKIRMSVILLPNFCIWKNIITYWIKVAFGWIKKFSLYLFCFINWIIYIDKLLLGGGEVSLNLI